MTQHEVRSANFRPSWPEVAGFGEGTPQQAIFEISLAGKLKNVQVSIHFPACRLADACKTIFMYIKLSIKVLEIFFGIFFGIY
jgi:hypothetical protein